VRPVPRSLASALLTTALLTTALGTLAYIEPPRLNVVVITMDTTRADALGAYGQRQPTSPRIDAMARAGVLFEDVTAPAPWTWPSHASIFTGEPPWVHGAHSSPPPKAVQNGESAGRDPIDNLGLQVTRMREDLPTLAERLESAGYYSDLVATNVWLNESLGLSRGFFRVQTFDRDSKVIDATLAQIESAPDRPHFLFVNLLSAHLPYEDGPGKWSLEDPSFFVPETSPDWARPYLRIKVQPHGIDLNSEGHNGEKIGLERYLSGELRIPEEGMQTLRTLYDSSVRAADFGLGRILAAWTTRHPEGIVIVASDHGEAFGEHQLLEHRHGVYTEELRVPLVFAAPGRVVAGQRISTPVQLESIYETVLELAGLESTEGSLLRLVEQYGSERPKHVSANARVEPIQAAIWPDQSLSKSVGGRFEKTWFHYREADRAIVLSDSGDVEFFDLGADPQMLRDLGPNPLTDSDRALLDRAQQAFRTVRGSAVSEPLVELDEQTRKQLKSLGYAD
jgi:arylsulfatase A-like enzyme